jgi:hypothetical protein
MQVANQADNEIFKNKTDLATATTSQRQQNEEYEELSDDFVPDDDFLKKYYYDEETQPAKPAEQENSSQGSITTTLATEENTETEEKHEATENIASAQPSEEISYTSNISPQEEIDTKVEQTTSGNEDYEYSFEDFNTPSTLEGAMEAEMQEGVCIESETETVVEEQKSTETNRNSVEEPLNEDNETHNIENKADEQEANKEQTSKTTENKNTKTVESKPSEKVDKIVSNVCINIGGTSSNTQNGFVGIQLTMTEKPVEPDAPPKRKRGRPPKKKKT